jgi:hypothetical protein
VGALVWEGPLQYGPPEPNYSQFPSPAHPGTLKRRQACYKRVLYEGVSENGGC